MPRNRCYTMARMLRKGSPMNISSFYRYAAAVSLSTLLGACSVFSDDDEPASVAVTERSSECRWNRQSCIYEGRYESDERDYAEEEARRLNQAQAARLRRAW